MTLTRKKAKRFTATDIQKMSQEGKGRTGPPLCKLCEARHWARDPHQFTQDIAKSSRSPRPARGSNSESIGKDLQSSSRPAPTGQRITTKRRTSILLDNISAIQAGDELTEHDRPASNADRQSKWRRLHPAKHRANCKAYNKRVKDRP